VIADAESARVIGTIWLTMGLVVIALIVARLWETLPADRGFRRRLGGWLAALVAAMSLYSAWMIYSSPRSPQGATQLPSGWSSGWRQRR
jgi:uncharacterized membrane protein